MKKLIKLYESDGWRENLGILASEGTDGSVLLELPYIEKNLNRADGAIHGGVLASLMQDAGLLNTVVEYGVEPGQVRLIDAQISYISGSANELLSSRVRFTRKAKTLAFVDVEAVAEDGRLVANSRLLFQVSKGGERVSTTVHDQPPEHIVPTGQPLHPLVESLGSNTEARQPGMSVVNLSAGLCQLQLEDASQFRSFNGSISTGAQLYIADSCGVFGSFAQLGIPLQAATIDFKMSFCEDAQGEAVVATGDCQVRRHDVFYNTVKVYGVESRRLKAFGTLSFWAKLPEPD